MECNIFHIYIYIFSECLNIHPTDYPLWGHREGGWANCQFITVLTYSDKQLFITSGWCNLPMHLNPLACFCTVGGSSGTWNVPTQMHHKHANSTYRKPNPGTKLSNLIAVLTTVSLCQQPISHKKEIVQNKF